MISNYRSRYRFWAGSAAVVLLFLAARCRAQDGDAPTLTRARACFAQGDTFSAVTEYDRFLFFCHEQRQAYRICREVADSFLSRSCFVAAGRWLALAAEKADDSVKPEVYLASVAAFIRGGNHQEALYLLQFIDTAGAGKGTTRSYLLYRGILLLYSYQWDNAFGCLREYLAPCPSMLRSFDEWTGHNAPPRGRSRTVAQILSLLVPGAGQAYSGDMGGAINGIILNGVTGYPAVAALLSSEWIDASLYIWLFSRFYFGGLEVAAEKADLASDRLRLRYARRSMDNLLKIIPSCSMEAGKINKKER